MSKKLLSIQLIPSVSIEGSGPSISVPRLCESIINCGCNLQLITLDLSTHKSSNLLNYQKSFKISFGPKRLGISLGMYIFIYHICRHSDLKVIIHNHGMWQFNSLYPSSFSGAKSVKLVQSPRGAMSSWSMGSGSFFKRPFWWLFQKRALNKIDCFHATSELEADEIRALGFKQPIAIIPNGIDIPEYRKSSVPKKQRVLLFMSRIHPKKGISDLLFVWEKLQDQFPEWDLMIAGEDDGYYGSTGYLDAMKKLSVDRKLKRVNFLGGVYGHEKNKLFSHADLFVLPSYSENFGMVVAESLAAGTPVITTTATPWINLDKIDSGWCINPGPNNLLECMRIALSKTPDEFIRMGMLGRNWMSNEFSWKVVGERMSLTYSWLFSDNGVEKPIWIKGG